MVEIGRKFRAAGPLPAIKSLRSGMSAYLPSHTAARRLYTVPTFGSSANVWKETDVCGYAKSDALTSKPCGSALTLSHKSGFEISAFKAESITR